MKNDFETDMFDALTRDYEAAVLIRLSEDPADDGAYGGKMTVRGPIGLQLQAVLSATENLFGKFEVEYGPEKARLATELFGRVLRKYGYGKKRCTR